MTNGLRAKVLAAHERIERASNVDPALSLSLFGLSIDTDRDQHDAEEKKRNWSNEMKGTEPRTSDRYKSTQRATAEKAARATDVSC